LNHDIEDMVTLLDGRTEIVEEILASEKKLKSTLRGCFNHLLRDDRFIEALPGMMPGAEDVRAANGAYE